MSHIGLSGMERTLSPSLQHKKQSSQSPNQYKPLPPTPSLGRRISLSPPAQKFIFEEGQEQQQQQPRRASSIYSRTASAWYNTAPRAPSLDEHPIPKISSVYRGSLSPSATMSEPQLLLPRTYTPLIRTPSPLSTPESSPAPRPPYEQRPSALLPLPTSHPTLPKKHLHTISLDQAQAVQHASGAEHLLPEELRARITIAKAKSTEHIVKLADQTYDKPQKPGSAMKANESTTIRLPSMMMMDAGTWHTFDPSLHGPTTTLPSKTFAPPAHSTRWSGSTAIAMSRDQSRSQTGSEAASLPPFDEPERGRTMQRGSRIAAKQQPAQAPADAGVIAAEYTSMLDSPWDVPTPTHSPNVDNRAQFKLAPQPLFAFKPTAGPPGTFHHTDGAGSISSVSPKGLPESDEDYDSDDSQYGTPPPQHFFLPDTDDESPAQPDSRTGSIPISPPLMAPPLPPSPTIPSPPLATVQPVPVTSVKPRLMSARTKAQYRESAYYPYVGRRRGRTKAAMSATAVHKSSVRTQPNAAIHAARAAIQSTVSPDAQAPQSKRSEVSDLLTRATNKAVKIADKLTRPAEHQGDVQPTSPAHLSQSVTAVYLGWSEESKEDFDASKAISPKLHYAAGKFTPRPSVKQTYSHVVTAARPLDERPIALAEPTEFKRPSHSRKGSMLSGLLDISREKGREKRREDIKKTIRMIPNAPSEDQATRPEPFKSASEADVPSKPQTPPVRRVSIWARRISEFGLI